MSAANFLMGGWEREYRAGIEAALPVYKVTIVVTYFIKFHLHYFYCFFCIDIFLIVSDVQLYEETGNFNQ